jgi:hypothetical protein
MRPLDDQTIVQRVITTAIIIIVIVLLLAFIGWISGGWNDTTAAAAVQVPIDPRYERKFIELDRAAIEEAYRDQIQHLFETWMKDESGQPSRAVVGAKRARKAFANSMDAIDERERQLKEMQR